LAYRLKIFDGLVEVFGFVRGVMMQKTSRTPPVTASDHVEAGVMRLQRGGVGEETSRSDEIEQLSALMERASHAARQMKYFSLASKRFSFDDLVSSARRAGFIQIAGNPQLNDASFQWASGPPDLIFSASFRDPARISIVAETQADVFGLILTAYSHAASISVEINPAFEDNKLGRNARLFKDMLLTFPGFDDTPAWAKFPEGHMAEGGGVVEMWRDGVSLASVVGRAWNSISARVHSFRNALRDRS
jgi:hypothetical protein